MPQSDTHKPADSNYDPDVFSVDSMASAKNIILTPEPGTSTDERWEKETPYLIEQIAELLKPNEHSCLLDYGCGIGRLSKALIESFNCTVIGVDISMKMRSLATEYVQSTKFSVWSPAILDAIIADGFYADHAISIWVLQHCQNPLADINRIKSALPSGGMLYAVNSNYRLVPTKNGWINDGIDMKELLLQSFTEERNMEIPGSVTTEDLAKHSFVKLLRKT